MCRGVFGGRVSAGAGVLVRPGIRFWVWGLLAGALVLVLPLADLAVNLFSAAGEVWRHMAAAVLPRYAANTVVLSGGVIAAAGNPFFWGDDFDIEKCSWFQLRQFATSVHVCMRNNAK